MKPIDPDFGNHSFGSEMRRLCSALQLCLGLTGPTAELIVRQAAIDAQQMAKDSESVEYGLPISFWANWEFSNSYALAVVKLCPRSPTGEVRKLPLMLKQWVARIDDAVCKNDEGRSAMKLAGEKIEKCPGCKQWKVDGKITHLENCPDQEWGKVAENQKNQSSQQQERLKINAAIATAKKKAKLGPSINAPAPKKSKLHPQSNWPPIVPGGAVESNRRKF